MSYHARIGKPWLIVTGMTGACGNRKRTASVGGMRSAGTTSDQPWPSSPRPCSQMTAASGFDAVSISTAGSNDSDMVNVDFACGRRILADRKSRVRLDFRPDIERIDRRCAESRVVPCFPGASHMRTTGGRNAGAVWLPMVMHRFRPHIESDGSARDATRQEGYDARRDRGHEPRFPHGAAPYPALKPAHPKTKFLEHLSMAIAVPALRDVDLDSKYTLESG